MHGHWHKAYVALKIGAIASRRQDVHQVRHCIQLYFERHSSISTPLESTTDVCPSRKEFSGNQHCCVICKSCMSVEKHIDASAHSLWHTTPQQLLQVRCSEYRNRTLPGWGWRKSCLLDTLYILLQEGIGASQIHNGQLQ